jgi:membrane protein
MHGGMLVQTGDDPPAYLPSRDIGSITLKDLLYAVRTAGEEQYLGPQSLPAPAEIESIMAKINAAIEAQVHARTLRDLVAPAPETPAPPTMPGARTLLA